MTQDARALPKGQRNFRPSDLTTRQLRELAARWGTTITATIAIAIDRVYTDVLERQEEMRND